MLRTLVTLAAFLIGAVPALAQRKVMLNVSDDVGVSSVRGHFLDSNVSAPSAALRQNQNWSGFETKALLVKFDTRPVQGWNIQEAFLHLFVAKEDLYAVGVCEVLAPWNEDQNGARGAKSARAASWQYAHNPVEDGKPQLSDYWAWAGSTLTSVSWSHPMARYSYAGPGLIQKTACGYPGESPDYKPFVHLRFPVKPAIVAAMVAGTNYGIVLTDDKGQVAESYSLIGAGYPYRYNEAADPYIFTRDVQDESLRPVLEVVGTPGEKKPVAAPKDLKVVGVQPSTSSVTLEFIPPQDDLLAYEVTAAPAGNPGAEQSLPRWEIPLPGKAGSNQRMPVWTLAPGAYTLSIRAIDMAGNRSPAAQVAVNVPEVPSLKLVEAKTEAQGEVGKAVTFGDGRVYAVPDVVKVDPVSGAVLQGGDVYRIDENYALVNPVYRAGGKPQVSLQAAGNEVVAFQVIVEKGAKSIDGLKISMSDLASASGTIAANPNAQFFREWYIKSSAQQKRQLGPNEVEDVKIRPVAWHADAAVPMADPFGVTASVPAAGNNIEGQTNQAIWVDLYVPKGTKPGEYRGEVTVEAQGIDGVKMSVQLTVLPLALPDKSSWNVELNSYGGLLGVAGVNDKDPRALDAQWDFYRLAKQHRQMYSAVPYGQRGHVNMAEPKLEGEGANTKVADWTEFDRFYGPLLDGSAFTADKGYVGPNAGTPISEMYTAFHENWPLPLDKWYQDYAPLKTRLELAAWAKKSRLLEDAFPEQYKQGYTAVVRQFAQHCQEKNWTGTVFQIFGNNKYYFKVPYFASQLTTGGNYGSSFWLLDEPTDYDDYMANAFFLNLAKNGWTSANAPDVKFAYRVDVSQPEMARGLWDNICNLWVLGGGAIRNGYVATATVRQKWLPEEEFWHYGGGPNLSAAPSNMLQAFLESWASGSSGILPYWTTDGGKDWVKPNDPDLALFYPGKNYANSGKNCAGPLPSLRLKTMRRAQQDIEYLYLLAGQKQWDRAAVRRAIAAYANEPDAPVLTFTKMDAVKQFQLRNAVTATILGSVAP